MQDYLLIGEITKPQGVQGELKVRPITCDPWRFEDMTYAFVLEGDNYRKVEIKVRKVNISVEGIRI